MGRISGCESGRGTAAPNMSDEGLAIAASGGRNSAPSRCAASRPPLAVGKDWQKPVYLRKNVFWSRQRGPPYHFPAGDVYQFLQIHVSLSVALLFFRGLIRTWVVHTDLRFVYCIQRHEQNKWSGPSMPADGKFVRQIELQASRKRVADGFVGRFNRKGLSRRGICGLACTGAGLGNCWRGPPEQSSSPNPSRRPSEIGRFGAGAHIYPPHPTFLVERFFARTKRALIRARIVPPIDSDCPTVTNPRSLLTQRFYTVRLITNVNATITND